MPPPGRLATRRWTATAPAKTAIGIAKPKRRDRPPVHGVRDRKRVAIAVSVAARPGRACRRGRSQRSRPGGTGWRPPTGRRQSAVREEQQGPRDKHHEPDEDPVVDPGGPPQQPVVSAVRNVHDRGHERPERRTEAPDDEREPEQIPRVLRENERAERRTTGCGRPEDHEWHELLSLEGVAVDGKDGVRGDDEPHRQNRGIHRRR